MELREVSWLWALWLLPVLALVLRWARQRRDGRTRAFAGDLARRLSVNGGSRVLQASLVLVSLGVAALALARPAWGVYYAEVRHEGVDVVVLIDVSKSMLAEDATPNRLRRAHIAVGRLVDKLSDVGGHRIALIAFAGTPAVRCPLTVDYRYFREVLMRTDVQSSPRGGTLIGDAVRRGLTLFEDEGEQERVMLLLTDGEDHESFPIEAAKAAAVAGVAIYPVGIGDRKDGGRIPVTDESGQRRFVEFEGETVVSRLDEETLLEIAKITGGAYVPAGTRAIPLGRIYEEAVASRRGGVHGVTKERRLHERFQWFVGLALLLAVASRFAARRPEEWS